MCVFLPADILLPKVDEIEKWSVIACDQFTSQPEYWREVREYIGDAPSTVNLIFPEAELGADKEKKIEKINLCMKEYISNNLFERHSGSYVYVERTMMNGKIRKGIVGVVDLEAYDYVQGAKSYIRATEQTVVERIPPRMAIRRDATLELPHILLFCDDSEKILVESLEHSRSSMPKVYDLDLMKEGGHISGWLVQGRFAAELEKRIQKYEEGLKAKYAKNNQAPMLYAVGDGNHSLATAKACYEELKRKNRNIDLSTHPARYALVELENIHDEVQKFEPIHRILTKVNVSRLLSEMQKTLCSDEGTPINYYYGGEKGTLHINKESGQLEVGILQAFLDEYLDKNNGEMDYIHGEDVLKMLLKEDDAIGFVLPTIDKTQLFSGIMKDGVLPRKTFSMGHAQDKRYYTECRKIR